MLFRLPFYVVTSLLIALLIVVALLPVAPSAQAFQVSVTLEPTVLYLGDDATLTFSGLIEEGECAPPFTGMEATGTGPGGATVDSNWDPDGTDFTAPAAMPAMIVNDPLASTVSCTIFLEFTPPTGPPISIGPFAGTGHKGPDTFSFSITIHSGLNGLSVGGWLIKAAAKGSSFDSQGLGLTVLEPRGIFGPEPNAAPELLNASITPTFGDSSTVFLAEVTYLDKENQKPYPKPVQVILDGIAFAMIEADPADSFFGDGKTFAHYTKLTVGNHTFSFTASDGTDTVSTSQLHAIVTPATPTDLPITISATTISNEDGKTSTTFTPGEKLLIETNVKNPSTTSKSFLVSTQVLDPEETALPPTFIKMTLDAGQEFTFKPSILLPSDAKPGTWTAETVVFTDLPSEGGTAIVQPQKVTFSVDVKNPFDMSSVVLWLAEG